MPTYQQAVAETDAILTNGTPHAITGGPQLKTNHAKARTAEPGFGPSSIMILRRPSQPPSAPSGSTLVLVYRAVVDIIRRKVEERQLRRLQRGGSHWGARQHCRGHARPIRQQDSAWGSSMPVHRGGCGRRHSSHAEWEWGVTSRR